MEALQMQETRSMKALGEKLNHIHEVSGTSYQSIADAAEVNRSYVSTLANRGARGGGSQADAGADPHEGSAGGAGLLRLLRKAPGDRRGDRDAGNGQDHGGGHHEGQAAPRDPH